MDQKTIWEHFQNQSRYDAFEGAVPRYRFIAQNILSEDKVLNIGVGRGGLEKLLINRGIDISALDPSETSIDIIKSLGLNEKAIVGFSQDIPFSSESFDVVIMSEVIEHLDDIVLNKTLKEVYRVLRVGGKFIGTVPANENLQDNQCICPNCDTLFHRWGHVQAFSRESLRNVIERHSFRKVVTRYVGFPDWRRSGVYNHLKSIIRWGLGRIGHPLAIPNIYFEATK